VALGRLQHRKHRVAADSAVRVLDRQHAAVAFPREASTDRTVDGVGVAEAGVPLRFVISVRDEVERGLESA
jgi:hypothetical protein